MGEHREREDRLAELDTSARLIDALLDEGEAVDSGQFTLDGIAAAAKLEAFTYADRSVYLVPLIEGLIGLGAGVIELRSRRRGLVVEARDLTLTRPAEQLADVYTHALGHGQDPRGRALGRLAIAFDMVLGTAPSTRVLARYTDASQTIAGEYRHRARARVVHRPRDSRSDPGLRVIVERGVLSGPLAGGEAIEHLREAVRHSAHPIDIDDERVSERRRDWYDSVTGQGPGYAFEVGLTWTATEPAIVELWTGGVRSEQLAGEGIGTEAVIEITQPRRDLSQMRLVRDPNLEQALTAVASAREQLLERLAERDADWDEHTRPSAWPRERVERILGRPAAASQPPPQPPPRPPVAKRVATQPQPAGELRRGDWRTGPAWGLLVFALLTALLLRWITVELRYTELPDLRAWEALTLLASAAVLGAAGFLVLVPHRIARVRDLGVRRPAMVSATESVTSGPTDKVHWTFTDDDGREQRGRSFPRHPAEVAEWRPGETIFVYCDPRRPTRSYWEADVGPARSPAETG
jgi:hypothetical protein